MLRFGDMDGVSLDGDDIKRILPFSSISLLVDEWTINRKAGKGHC